MQLTAEMILTDFGAKLPLDQRRKDALAHFARAEHSRTQTRRGAQAWCEDRWGLKDYEAKDLLKGNASETVWERIVKHPNGGWSVVIPVMGAVIGMSLESYIERQAQEARLERAQWEATEKRLAELSARVAERRRLDREANQQARAAGPADARVGRNPDGSALDPPAFWMVAAR
jgi:hypothetical protein